MNIDWKKKLECNKGLVTCTYTGPGGHHYVKIGGNANLSKYVGYYVDDNGKPLYDDLLPNFVVRNVPSVKDKAIKALHEANNGDTYFAGYNAHGIFNILKKAGILKED